MIMSVATRALLGIIVLTLACSRPGGPESTSNEFGDDAQVFKSGLKCTPVVSAEKLPPRTVVFDPSAAGPEEGTIFTSSLFDQFNTLCGACHVASNRGNWAVPNKAALAQLLTRDVVERRLKTDKPDEGGYMPPANSGGRPYSQRGANDLVVQFVRLTELWLAQGSPLDQFSLGPPDSGATDAGADPDGGAPNAPEPTAPRAVADYSLTPGQAAALTNIGTCVPNRYTVGLNHQTMDGLDTFFSLATELPDTLAETDLTTFESDALARDGVVSFAPAYPLWSDSAGKMRHVRVPRGQSIAFDASTQLFSIPRNTRFYKTFFKKVIQLDGSVVEKKIETRLIVARPDHKKADGTEQPTALFGTYLWNEAETEAVLMKDPQHDGNPFADRVLTFTADEPRAATIRATNPRNLEYALTVTNPGVRRHYAVPSSDRCVQCHMGSPSASFVLGFTPLQLATRPPGYSGVLEPAAGDELTQLERLIAYGVVTGMKSPSEVVPLEQTQLPRTPRNEYELRAQAYLLGNCAHCHNPRGFPSIKEHELQDVLNFLPGPKGGVFQFPLDLVSPVRARGAAQDVKIPYITPSLRDVPPTSESAEKSFWCSDPPAPETARWCTKPPTRTPDEVLEHAYQVYVEAPWRSLIYRNVDTPFDYVDDSAIFPHMPMNTPNYDCRVAPIMGDWMVSIPAARFEPDAKKGEDVDPRPQPYYEVLPGDPAYTKAVNDAKTRIASYHAGHRYEYCPDTTDILDPLVGTGMPPAQTPAIKPLYSSAPSTLIMPGITPQRGHWVVTDATDPPGDWLPRGGDWKDGVVNHKVPSDFGLVGTALTNLRSVVETLPQVRITPEMRTAFLTEVPFAPWKVKPECDFSSVPKFGDFTGSARPVWFNSVVESRDAAAPVYALSPGAAVFTNICVNCHGPNADAKGLLADAISIMTGGNARVANFRTGLFGPLGDKEGANRQRVFGPDALAPDTADDLGARYLSFMALGGTRKQIPLDLIKIVAVSPVAGKPRRLGAQTGSANMLELARQMCEQVVLADSTYQSATIRQTQTFLDWVGQTALITANGDAELWFNVCSFGNRSIVRVLYPNTNGSESEALWTDGLPESEVASGKATKDLGLSSKAMYWADGYPADADVLDHRGQVRKGVTPDNLVPTCVGKPQDPTALGVAERSRHVGGTEGFVIPWCPESLFVRDGTGARKWQLKVEVDVANNGRVVFPDAKAWATRGAINAGFAVFLYLDQVAKGLVQPKPTYNRCELLGKAAAH